MCHQTAGGECGPTGSARPTNDGGQHSFWIGSTALSTYIVRVVFGSGGLGFTRHRRARPALPTPTASGQGTGSAGDSRRYTGTRWPTNSAGDSRRYTESVTLAFKFDEALGGSDPTNPDRIGAGGAERSAPHRGAATPQAGRRFQVHGSWFMVQGCGNGKAARAGGQDGRPTMARRRYRPRRSPGRLRDPAQWKDAALPTTTECALPIGGTAGGRDAHPTTAARGAADRE